MQMVCRQILVVGQGNTVDAASSWSIIGNGLDNTINNSRVSAILGGRLNTVNNSRMG